MEKIKYIAAVILLILRLSFLTMALTVEWGNVMDPIRQQIHDESMIM